MAKMIMAVLVTILAAHSPAGAGDISIGATPGTINYQGRLERDNSPVTGTVHIYFRVFNSPTGANLGTCGTPAANPCLWQSPEITVQAVQGMFTAAIAPPISVFSSASDKYLEVEIENETLSPREKINSVIYSYIAKKLEDGASVAVSTFTSAYSVYLATVSGNVGIGTMTPGNKLTVNGIIEILSGGIVFPNASYMTSAGVGSASGVSASEQVIMLADSNGLGADGDFIFQNSPVGELARMNYLGNMGVGDFSLSAPMGKLDVDGSLYVGDEGIYSRDASTVNVMGSLYVANGRVIGGNSEQIRIGETNDRISLFAGGSERVRLANADLGVGLTAPTERLHVGANAYANYGVRGGSVSIGGYTTWNALWNEVRSQDNTHLLLQQTNSFNVGVGTDTPREKLHVRGSVRADYGVIASSGHFSGSGITGSNPTLDVRGNLRANTGLGNTVELSSTVVYGTLQVTGGILGSAGGTPAYLSDNQIFTGRNTFTSLVTVSSDVVISPRLGVGMSGFDFGLAADDRYLQVGDNIPAYDAFNAHVYVVGGTNADAKLNLYRGGVQAARVETQGANTLALVTGGATRALINPSYFTIQNSPVWVSPSGSGDPALFVSAAGSVGLGEQVTDPTWRLTVDGGIRLLSGPLIFPDGSSMTSSSATSATSVSSLSDALVQAGTDGSGSVIIKSGAADGILVDITGRVGVGTTSPLAKLNVRGGDLVVGSPFQGGYATNGAEDLLVGGSLVVDNAIVQRSAVPVQFAGAVIYGDVYLSTATSAKTGVGTSDPKTTLDVNGDAQFGTGAQKSTFTAAGALNLRTPLTVVSGGTGVATLASNGMLYGNGTGVVQVTAAGSQYQVLRAGAGGTPAFGSVNLDQSAAVTGTLPVGNGGTGADLSSTGGANQFVRQGASGAGFTVSAIADADVPDNITINGTNNVTWNSVNKTGSSLADLATRSAGDLTSGTLAVARGGTGASTAADARTNLGLGSGLSQSFTVAKSTDPAQNCRQLTFTNGILTGAVDANCNP